MQISEIDAKILLGQPIYDPEEGAFRAAASVHAAGTVFDYRARFHAAPYAEFDAVTRGLKANALAQHGQAQDRVRKLLVTTVRAATSRVKTPNLGAFLAA